MKTIEKILQKELNKLQNTFNTGFDLRVKYLPNETRVSELGKHLSGEIQGGVILIYEHEKEKAIKTLFHEFVEYLLASVTKDYLEIINSQNQIITRLLYGRREVVVEQLVRGLQKEIIYSH